jgi:hypothetical protein
VTWQGLQDRDRRALLLLIPVASLIILYALLSGDDSVAPVVESIDNIPAAEKRLQRLRQLAASVPGKEQVLAQARAELEQREQGLIQADTAAQAQAQLLQTLRQLAKAQTTPIDLRNTEMGQVKPFGDRYGEVAVSANFECGIEQLLNLLADLTAQKEIIGTTELRIGSAHPKQKTMPVRLTISGVVRRELVADKKGPVTF